MHGDVPPTVRFAVRTDLDLCTDQLGRCVEHECTDVVTDVEHRRSLPGRVLVAGQVLMRVIVRVIVVA